MIKNLVLTLGFALMCNFLGADDVVWMVNDFPPYVFLDGPNKDRGVVEQLIQLVQARLKNRHIVLVEANNSRVHQSFQSGQNGVYGTFLRTKEREAYAYFSQPWLNIQTSGVMVHDSTRAIWSKYLGPQGFDLEKALEDPAFSLGTLKDIWYGSWINDTVSRAPEGRVQVMTPSAMAGTVEKNQLRMTQMGRLTALAGYEEGLRLNMQAMGMAPEGFRFLRVKGSPEYLAISVAVTKNPWGEAFLKELEPLLVQFKPQLAEEYRKWLSPESAKRHLQAGS